LADQPLWANPARLKWLQAHWQNSESSEKKKTRNFDFCNPPHKKNYEENNSLFFTRIIYPKTISPFSLPHMAEPN
jgi:hypothetical protein